MKRGISIAVMVTIDDFVTDKYIKIKEHAAKDIGVTLDVKRFSSKISTEDFLREVLHVARDYDGIVVQMPLAPHIDVEAVRQLIPITHDVDVFGTIAFTHFQENRLPILPPVTGAVAEILLHNDIHVAGKNVVIVGEGRLVGLPTSIWAGHMGAEVHTVNRETLNVSDYTQKADIIVAGAGVPGLITPDMVKEGVVIIDGGTSESNGKLVGDADPACAEKAAVFTPVPGGVGPVAIALLYKNLLILTYKRLGITDYEALLKLDERKMGEKLGR